jgi:hypothetical protein
MQYLGFCNLPTQHLGTCISSLAQRQSQASASEINHAEQDFWASTIMLVVGILDVRACAQTVDKKIRASTCLATLLKHATSTGFSHSVHLDDFSVAQMQLCHIDIDDGVCSCVRALRDRLACHAGPAPQERFVARLIDMHETLQCLSVAARFSKVLESIAEEIDGNVERWGKFDWHKSDAYSIETGDKRRKRMDFHVQRYLVWGAVADGKATTPGIAAKALDGVTSSMVVRKVQSEMAAFQAATRLSFPWPTQISLTHDAFRIGKPAKEILAGIVRHLGSKVNTALPPAVQ